MQLTMHMSRLASFRMRAGSLRRKESVSEALRRVLDGCRNLDGSPVDRETISKELSRLVGENISVHTLNNWCAQGKENRRFPLEYAEAIALITGDRGIVDAAFVHFRVLDELEVPLFEMGKLVIEDRSRSRRRREMLELATRNFRQMEGRK